MAEILSRREIEEALALKLTLKSRVVLSLADHRKIEKYDEAERAALRELPSGVQRILRETGVPVVHQMLLVGLRDDEFTEADIVQQILTRYRQKGEFIDRVMELRREDARRMRGGL